MQGQNRNIHNQTYAPREYTSMGHPGTFPSREKPYIIRPHHILTLNDSHNASKTRG